MLSIFRSEALFGHPVHLAKAIRRRTYQTGVKISFEIGDTKKLGKFGPEFPNLVFWKLGKREKTLAKKWVVGGGGEADFLKWGTKRACGHIMGWAYRTSSSYLSS